MSADGLVRFGFTTIGSPNKSLDTKSNPSTDDFQACNNIYVRALFCSFDIGKSRLDGGWNDQQALNAQGFIHLKDNHGGEIFATVTSVYAEAGATNTSLIVMLSNPTYTATNQLTG